MSLRGPWAVVSMEVDGALSPLVEWTSIRFEIGDYDRIAGKALNRFRGSYDSGSDDPFGLWPPP